MSPAQQRLLNNCAQARGWFRTNKANTAYGLVRLGYVQAKRVFDCNDQGCKVIAVDVKINARGRTAVVR